MKKLVFTAIIAMLGTWGYAQLAESSACDPTADKAAVKAFDKAKKMAGLEKVRAIHEIVKEHPDFYEALFEQAITLVRLQKLTQAVYRFEEVYAICPDYSPYTAYYLGLYYFETNDYPKALPYLKKFMAYSGETVRISDEDYDKAKKMLQRAGSMAEVVTQKVPFNPVAVANVSTSADEYSATLSPDNEFLYFIRKVRDTRDSRGAREIFTESKNTSWVFDRGQEMPPPFNISSNNGAATITADNKIMYFVNCQNNDFAACDIWYSERKGIGWTNQTPVPGKLNKGTDWDSSPSVSFDGKEIIFTSNRPGGKGGVDLYSSRKMPDGTWSEAQNLGAVINTSENENTPFLHSDSKTLYFSSKGHNSLGGYDIFFSRQDENGNWSEPKNIGVPINTDKDEVNFFVSLDGKRAFFSSGNLNGPGGLDVYMFELHEEARPQAVRMIKGEVRSDSPMPKDAEVEIKNLRTKEVQKVEVDKNDGKYVAIISDKEDYVMTLKKEGMAFSSQLIEKDQPTESGLVKADLEMKKIETGKVYNINNINFATNSYELPAKAKAVLEGFSEFLKTNPALKVTIQGHTDNVGDDNANLLLSENRAKAVMEYLRGTGINAGRLAYKGYGESMPIADNQTEAGRAKNRRTEFLIVSQ